MMRTTNTPFTAKTRRIVRSDHHRGDNQHLVILLKNHQHNGDADHHTDRDSFPAAATGTGTGTAGSPIFSFRAGVDCVYPSNSDQQQRRRRLPTVMALTGMQLLILLLPALLTMVHHQSPIPTTNGGVSAFCIRATIRPSIGSCTSTFPFTPTPSFTTAAATTTTTTTIATTQLAADLRFSGDSQASLEFEVPSIDHVLEWLHTPSLSDYPLLGTTNARPAAAAAAAATVVAHNESSSSSSSIWECPQPSVDFMGMEVKPTFVSTLERHPPPQNTVIVKVIDSKTIIGFKTKKNQDDNDGSSKEGSSSSSSSSTSRVHQVVESLMGRAKFQGTSIIQARPQHPPQSISSAASITSSTTTTTTCVLLIELNLTLHVPLPPFVLLPPGFNAMGSSIVQRTGKSRTQKLLYDLKEAYLEWAAAAATDDNVSASTSASAEEPQEEQQEGQREE